MSQSVMLINGYARFNCLQLLLHSECQHCAMRKIGHRENIAGLASNEKRNIADVERGLFGTITKQNA